MLARYRRGRLPQESGAGPSAGCLAGIVDSMSLVDEDVPLASGPGLEVRRPSCSRNIKLDSLAGGFVLPHPVHGSVVPLASVICAIAPQPCLAVPLVNTLGSEGLSSLSSSEAPSITSSWFPTA